ncbi:hypothetical protein HAX54_014304, partial [Datura stramonium]|nr:hypothetical protein [Datura stramonium]
QSWKKKRARKLTNSGTSNFLHGAKLRVSYGITREISPRAKRKIVLRNCQVWNKRETSKSEAQSKIMPLHGARLMRYEAEARGLERLSVKCMGLAEQGHLSLWSSP